MDWIAETLANVKSLLICGDYNLHVNNPNDEDAANFLDTNTALGLKQHVRFATHTSGNRLDLIFTEVNSEIGIADCIPDSYISDHCKVLCKLTLKRQDTQKKTSTYTKHKDIDIEEMTKCIKATSSSEGNLDERVMDFNNALINALNVYAPLKSKQITIHRTVPWFTDDVRELKKYMRRREANRENIKEKTSGQHLK